MSLIYTLLVIVVIGIAYLMGYAAGASDKYIEMSDKIHLTK